MTESAGSELTDGDSDSDGSAKPNAKSGRQPHTAAGGDTAAEGGTAAGRPPEEAKALTGTRPANEEMTRR